MATKDDDHHLSKLKKELINGYSDSDKNDKYSNLNLKQSYKYSQSNFLSPKSTSNFDGRRNYDCFNQENYQRKNSKEFFVKSNQTFSTSLETLNIFESGETKKWKNDKSLNITSKSTFSYHISAYKNGIEVAADNIIDKIDKSQEKPKKVLMQNSQNLLIQHTFEIPRQQTDKATEPENMQFRASQQLLGSSRGNSGNNINDSSESTFSRSSEKGSKNFFGSLIDFNSSDRDSFHKSQLTAIQKVLNDQDAPLKQKHARVLIVGTHKERSAQVFWNTVSNTALEKHPIVTWKFCHLLHKLIRDGHRNVTSDSYKFKNRLVQLGNFWQHLRTSGYGGANFSYCNALVKRLEFHNKYEIFPGNFVTPSTNILVSPKNVNRAYELAVDLLDELEVLIEVQSKIGAIMTLLRLSSFTPSGQCVYGPTVQIILDTSKIYDVTCHLLFNLHSKLSPDVLDGHRKRFYKIFHELKNVYWDAKSSNFITAQISVPSLPENPPNFLLSSCMDNYQAPEANEKQQVEEDSMNQSTVIEDTIVDLNFGSEAQNVQAPTPLVKDAKDLYIEQLQHDNMMLRQQQDRIVQEAKSRINDYEYSLQSLHSELTKQTQSFGETRPKYEEEIRRLKQQLNESEQKRKIVEQNDLITATNDSSLMKANMEIQTLKRKISDTEIILLKLKNETNDSIQNVFSSFLKMLNEAGDDLHNATSITYPSHLIANALISDMELLHKITPIIKEEKISNELCEYLPLFGHRISNTIVNAAAAAYTASIEKYDGVNEVCKQLLQSTQTFMKDLKELNFEKVVSKSLPEVEEKLQNLSNTISKLPTLSGDIDAEQVGAELESEMDRVNKAIFDAVQMIEALQKKSRENATGVRMEVNDKILDSCNDLISAIRILVARSRDVQEEIVQQGKGTASPKEFYKRNHQWTEGLLSAAKAVGGAATYLVQCADGVVTNNGKFENLIIAAQEVAASVAQLYVSSRVKADKDSKKMGELGVASKSVNKCTATVVATVKSGQLDLADKALDFTNLSLHEAKKLEMESQVRTLELEAELERERIRLAGLRKKHYHISK